MKIEIKFEGENVQKIFEEIKKFLEGNKEEIKRLIRFIANETIDALEDKKILDRGAELYIKINRAINWKYRQEK